jgi:hypothetical protein
MGLPRHEVTGARRNLGGDARERLEAGRLRGCLPREPPTGRGALRRLFCGHEVANFLAWDRDGVRGAVRARALAAPATFVEMLNDS